MPVDLCKSFYWELSGCASVKILFMNRWGKVLRAVCEKAKEKGIELFILEADEDLNWFGMPIKEVCSEEMFSKSDHQLFKEVKGRVEEEVSSGPVIAYLSPINFQVDIYESDKRRFTISGTQRPFAVTREGFRIGFFGDKKEAVDFFIEVSKRLEEEGLSLHLFY